jgi:outer membrane protein OmpA-like peptidoglycan-associated protein
MNNVPTFLRAQLAAVAVAVLMAACASTPTTPPGAVVLRQRLNQLQADPQLAGRAPLAIEQANKAVTAAEKPQSDPATNAHLQFIADRKIAIASADAHNNWALDQRKGITERRAAMQLSARTQEADLANQRAAAANQRTVDAKQQTDRANQQTDLANQQTDLANQQTAIALADANNQKQQADAARDATAAAQRNASDLQQQIVELQGQVTDRGVVLTLGDVLFTSGTGDLNSGGSNRLSKLAGFLNKYPDKNVQIEGHTDSIGTDEYNQGLSQRRADSVKSFLTNQGVDARRLTAAGKGEGIPIGDNSTSTGRQQNRRVEVIIPNDIKVSSK